MVANIKTNIETQYKTWIENNIRAAIIRLGLLLHTLSNKLLALVDHQIATVGVHTPYTGPTYGKMANTTRQIIAGKITHEKNYTGNTGWLYATIAGLINRRTNTLTISLPDLIIESGLSKSTLLKHTIYLEDLGLIHVDRKRSGPKSNEINTYSLIGEGADITLHNGSVENIAAPKQGCQKNTRVVQNQNGKDSLQTTNKRHDVVVDNKKSVTPKIEFSSNQQAAMNALKEINLNGQSAQDIILVEGDNLERLFATIKYAQDTKSINNPPGYVRNEMKINESNWCWDIVSNGWQSLDHHIRQYLPKSPDDYADNDKPQTPPQITNTPPAMYDHPIGPQPAPLPEADVHIKEQWTIAYNQLDLQFDRSTFDTWIRGAQVIGCQDDVFVIAVRNSYVRDMLQHRLYRNIRRVLSDVCGHPIEMRFAVHHQEPEQQDDRMPLFRLLAQQQEQNY